MRPPLRTFGNVADGDIGEFLQPVVGITADYNGNIGISLTGTMFSKPGGGHTSLLQYAREVNPGPV